MRYFFVFLSLLSSCAATPTKELRKPSGAAIFSEVVRKNAQSARYCPTLREGEVCLMNWANALSFCKSQKAHLPTAREYAELIRSRGTVILEKSEVDGKAPKDFYFVDCKNPDGSLDGFYMNHSAYQRPKGETGNHLLWTASIPPQHPEYAHVYYDQWGGGGGDPKDHLLGHLNALQCVTDSPANRVPATEKPEDHFSHLPIGGRKGLHGMVIFGSGPYFLEHIPMLSPPHDFQIIAKVSVKGAQGKAITKDFAQAAFTLKPSADFSLNEYVAGRLRNFSGAIYEGSFEQGGRELPGLQSVKVEVLEYKFIRQLPADSKEQWLEVSDGAHRFESNVIRPEKNIQVIRNATTGKQLWCVKGDDFFEPCL